MAESIFIRIIPSMAVAINAKLNSHKLLYLIVLEIIAGIITPEMVVPML